MNDLDELRARVRGEAGATADQWWGWLEAADALCIQGVPRKVRRARAVTGKVDGARGNGGEHDFLELVSDVELERLRSNGWLRGEQWEIKRAAMSQVERDSRPVRPGDNADVVLDRICAQYGETDPDAAWSAWLRATRYHDAARAVAAGRLPGHWAKGLPWPSWVAPGCESDGIDIRAVMASRAVDDDERGALVATVHAMNAALVKYLERLVFPPKVKYAHDYAAALIAGTTPPADPGDSWAPDVRRKVDRYYRMEDAA